MKTIYKVLFALIIVLCSCTNMNITVQKVESPMDCESNDGWSWNDGEAKTTRSNSDGEFKFKSKLSGTLSFKVAENINSDYITSYLRVHINGQVCYDESTQKEPKNILLKNIPKNGIITFRGRQCMVKDVMISATIDENQKDSISNPDWF